MVHAPGELPDDPAVVLLNPEDEVSPETFAAWLNRARLVSRLFLA